VVIAYFLTTKNSTKNVMAEAIIAGKLNPSAPIPSEVSSHSFRSRHYTHQVHICIISFLVRTTITVSNLLEQMSLFKNINVFI
jgi:hypothetical protein